MREGWVTALLGDVAEVRKGTHAIQKTKPGKYPLVVTGAEWSSSETFDFDEPSVCVPLVSSTGHGHASIKRLHFADGEFAVASIMAACTPRDGSGLDARFLYLYLSAFKDSLIVTKMKGTANVSLSVTNLKNVEVSFPPIMEQRRIVDLVSVVDAAIEAADTEYLQATEFWSSALTLIAADQSSSMMRVADLVTNAKAGGTPKRDTLANYGGGVPWLKSGEVRGRLISETEETISRNALATTPCWLVPPGSILVAMYGATAGQVGRTAIPLTTNQAVLALVPETQVIHPELFFHLMSHESAKLKSKAVGAAQPNLSKDRIVNHQIRVPEVEKQVGLLERLNAMLDLEVAAHTHSKALRDLRSNLLTTLLSGEHVIPELYDRFLKGEVT